MVKDIIDRSIGPCKAALKDAGITPDKINEVVLVGGQTRMPRIQQLVKEVFGKEPHKGVNPDEVVAVGAAIQAGVLSGEVKDLLLLDVTPLTLGIETLGGVMTPLIERNTTIPTRKSESFSTAADNQTSVEIHVLQGERSMARDNRTLGKFQLIGIPPAPRGIPQIEVTFDIDANGIVHVTAKDLGTGKQQNITITSSSGLGKEEVDRMQKEAQAHSEEDKKRREEVDARNRADSLIYSSEKLLKENREKVSGDDAKAIESALEEAKQALNKGNTEEINAAVEKLNKATHKLAEAMYQQASAQQGAHGGPDGAAGGETGAGQDSGKKEGEVIDAEYVDVDDEKGKGKG